MKKIVERNMAEIVFITIVTLVMMSSCGVQFGNYERYKKVHRSSMCSEINKSVDELEYYVQEDVNNGNLNKEVSEFYVMELNKIKKQINN
tara:strand:+ start:357 stop:626 length:270 start_codon:yes stop_codon:yes gene_type:complete